jgi:hypothetical protein
MIQNDSLPRHDCAANQHKNDLFEDVCPTWMSVFGLQNCNVRPGKEFDQAAEDLISRVHETKTIAYNRAARFVQPRPH